LNKFKLYEFPYSKYLELVVKILEGQPQFTEKLKGMNEEEIKVIEQIIMIKTNVNLNFQGRKNC
jgi:hypothetical protein